MIEIKIDPVPKPRQTRADVWKKRPCVMRYRAFADELRLKCRCRNYTLGKKVNIDFKIKMPDSWTKKKKAELDGKPHQQKPDIDNLCKAAIDALLKEDEKVYELSASKRWAKEGSIVFDKNK